MNSIQRSQPTTTAENSAKRHVLILGLDGLRWSIAAEPGVGPALQKLAEQGTWHNMTMEVPTISGPGWSSILTGTTHAEHGVRDNSLVGGRLWNHPDVLSKAFYQDQSTRTFAAAGWPVLVDPNGLGPVIHPRVEQQKAGLHNVIARDGETHGYPSVDPEIRDITLAKLRADAFDAGFVYFCTVDDAGHIWGLMDDNYRRAISDVDAHVDSITTAVAQRAQDTGEDWLVIVTTDHGHIDEGGHGGDSPEEREAWVISWSPTGVVPQWPADIQPEELASLILAER